MSAINFTEDELEQATLDWFRELGYTVLFGPNIAPDGLYRERTDYSQVVLEQRLRESLLKINDLPAPVIDEAIRKLTITESPDLVENNQQFHEMITDGVDIEHRLEDGSIKSEKVWLFDFEAPDNNDWLVVNQYTVMEHDNNRRPDIVVFVNGLPLAVFELKSTSEEEATITKAYNQIQTYKNKIPSLFTYNEALVISDGVNAKIGTITANEERFMPWKTVDGDEIAPAAVPALHVLIQGVFEKKRFLDLIHYFVLFQSNNGKTIKILAAYHQYHAVNKAIRRTDLAISDKGDRRIGVVWHTQGSGKSLSMVFYAGKLVLGLDNPTIVVIADRNDLDNQLFQTFSDSKSLLRQTPRQAEDREDLKELLSVESGGIVFTTIQKFSKDEEDPVLTDRKNVIVIADEAHRSQYGFESRIREEKEGAVERYGYARYMRDALPEASYIGFTATPVELVDRNTPAVFGDYIDIYDMTSSVDDGMTVKIYYESRIAQVDLPEEEKRLLDQEIEEITEDQEEYLVDKAKSKWARLEAIVGAEKRIELIAQEIIRHFQKRQEAILGKAMVVVMSRRIAVDLYNEIIDLKPSWHSEDDDKGQIKVVMTGGSDDPQEWQKHIRTKDRRKTLEKRFKDERDPLEMVIVCSMWLTGFDVPCLHTMYLDKPMKGHNLMQAIARVNRVYKDKPGGLIVDFIGIADALKKALTYYTDTDRKNTGIDTEKAVALLLEKYEIVKDMFHGFNYSRFFTATPKDKMEIIAEAIDFILSIKDNGKKRFIRHVTELSKVFALCSTTEEAGEINQEIGFFKAVKSGIVKITSDDKKTPEQLDTAINQLVSKAIVSDDVVDILAAAGIKNPDLSILSDEFLEEVKHLQHKNLAAQLLERLLKGKVKALARKNLVKSRKFSEMLEQSVTKYQNRAIETQQVIIELIALAKEINKAQEDNRDIGLTEDELAFYDALSVNDAAVKIMGDEVLKKIAIELTESVRNNLNIDWNLRENVQAQMRVTIRRLLRKYNYPPDKREDAIKTVMDQAELMCSSELESDVV